MDTDKHGWKESWDRFAPGFGTLPNVEPVLSGLILEGGLKSESKLTYFAVSYPCLSVVSCRSYNLRYLGLISRPAQSKIATLRSIPNRLLPAYPGLK